MKSKQKMKRRKFIGTNGLLSVPLIMGLPSNALASDKTKTFDSYGVNLILEGYFFNPKQYIQKLSEIESETGINGDFYSQGGIIAELEEKFKKITGKESAIYMPSGTMANELSIRFLCDDKTKAIVHQDSHIYRDEGDAAQAIHNKRLVPINTGSQSFTLEELKSKLNELEGGETFYDGVGALSIENPVRRHNGKIVDFNQMQAITSYAKTKGIKTHLDGARIHIASAYSGISVGQYSSLFDTIYISLYKYLGATGGAILCGDGEVIEPMRHFMKILGGTVFRSWTNVAIANHFLDGIEERLQIMKEQSDELVSKLDVLDELQIEIPTEHTNIIFLKSNTIDLEKFADVINETHGIMMNYPDNDKIEVHFNESMLLRTNEQILSSFKDAIIKSS